jgi:A-kinase anchor protein 10
LERLHYSQVLITDVLFNDTALFHFMEYMEGEGQRPLVEFWMAAVNFQQAIERYL